MTLLDILHTQKRIKGFIRQTPLEFNLEYSRLYESEIYLKLENLQITGSFKPRGSFNKLLKLNTTERKHGVIAPSAGNHGIGLAYAAHQLGIPANVYIPLDADKGKVNVLKSYGASISYFDTIEDARIKAIEDAKKKGYTFLSAYSDPSMIAASGTIGLEILEELRDVDIVITCLGGGGLTAGICIALKSLNPDIQVWGVQTKNSPTFAVWHKNGKVTPIELQTSIAEGLSGTIEPETITFPIIHKHIDRIITVSEEELITAMQSMLKFQYIIEPSGAAGIAALPQIKGDIKGKKISIIVTGRNILWDRYYSLITDRNRR